MTMHDGHPLLTMLSRSTTRMYVYMHSLSLLTLTGREGEVQ